MRDAIRRPRRVLLALAAAGALAGFAATAPAAASPVAMTSGAISAVNGFAAEQLPATQLDAQLAAMHQDGVQIVRADAPWADIEPAAPVNGQHSWQFGQTDAWVAALAAHDLTWEPIIDYSVWWAKTCSGFCAPTSDASYATFAQAVAARYGAGGSFWSQHPQVPYEPVSIFEIWNEENVSTFYIDPAVYAGLYAAAQTAIHAADPSASVIVGGLADDSQSFNVNTDYPAWYVQNMLAADPALVGHIDGFGLHPYGATAADVEAWVADFRRILTNVGEGSAPIDITEVGWPAGEAGETWRAAQMGLLSTTLARSNCGIRMLAPYDWIDPGTQSESASDFGLVDPSGSSTGLLPSGLAWFAGLQQAASLPALPLCAAPTASTATIAGTPAPTTTTTAPTTTAPTTTAPTTTAPTTTTVLPPTGTAPTKAAVPIVTTAPVPTKTRTAPTTVTTSPTAPSGAKTPTRVTPSPTSSGSGHGTAATGSVARHVQRRRHRAHAVAAKRKRRRA